MHYNKLSKWDSAAMRKELIKIEEDRSGDIAHHRLPDFKNFGEKLDEIENAHCNIVLNDPKMPGILANGLSNMVNLIDNLAPQLDDKIEEFRKENPKLAKQLKENLFKMAEELSKDVDEIENMDDDDDEVIVKDQAKEDPEVFSVYIPDNKKWEKIYEDRLDEFLDLWPSVRQKALDAVFDDYYKKCYDDIWEFAGGEPHDKLILPDPADSSVIENIIRFYSIHIHAEPGRFGLEGQCTWDDEHGIGILIEYDKVLSVGGASTSFEPYNEQ